MNLTAPPPQVVRARFAARTRRSRPPFSPLTIPLAFRSLCVQTDKHGFTSARLTVAFPRSYPIRTGPECLCLTESCIFSNIPRDFLDLVETGDSVPEEDMEDMRKRPDQQLVCYPKGFEEQP